MSSVALVIGSLSVLACATDELPPGAGGSPSGGGGMTRCDEGATRSCSVKFEQGNGQLQCYNGTQECIDQAWGPCGDGAIRLQIDPTAAMNQDFFSWQSLSTDTSCAVNSTDRFYIISGMS